MQIDAAVEVRAAYTGSAICVAFGGVKDLPDAWKFRTGGFSCVVVCAPNPLLSKLGAPKSVSEVSVANPRCAPTPHPHHPRVDTVGSRAIAVRFPDE